MPLGDGFRGKQIVPHCGNISLLANKEIYFTWRTPQLHAYQEISAPS
jgi:hypothetical protein